MSARLKHLAVGSEVKVKGITATGRGYRQKLLSMGLTPGVQVKIIRTAPLGDPIEIELRGYLLSLRKDEADALEIERVEQ